MPAIIALLRGVNVGGHHKVSIDVLKTLCASLGCKDVRTHLNSGNAVFTSKSTNPSQLAARIETAIEKSLGFRPAVILRTTSELREAIAQCPFAARPGFEPSKLAVVFLDKEPSAAARDKVQALDTAPEEIHTVGRELFIYFPNGMGQSKLQMPRIDKLLAVTTTARNWNTTTKLLEIAEQLEAP